MRLRWLSGSPGVSTSLPFRCPTWVHPGLRALSLDAFSASGSPAPDTRAITKVLIRSTLKSNVSDLVIIFIIVKLFRLLSEGRNSRAAVR